MDAEPSTRLARFDKLHVEIIRKPDEELLRHLRETVLGTPGGLQYQHTQVREKLAHIRDIYFMLLKKSGHLLGSVGLVSRSTSAGNTAYSSWYVRYFSIRAPLRSRKPQPETAMKEASRSSGLLKSVAMPFFDDPGKLRSGEAREEGASFLYAYIEEANVRSLRFSEDMGLKTCRHFATVLFSRMKPQESSRVRRAVPEEYPAIREQLKKFYAGHTMYYPGNLFVNGNYFVHTEDGRMVAGLQAHSDAWKIMGRGGLAGKLLLKVLPGIPFVRRIFNPDDFRFLAIEGLWYEVGYERVLGTLLSSVCARLGVRLAMLWLDTGSPVLKAVDEHVDTGLFGRVVKRTEAQIRVRFYGFTLEAMEEFCRKPAYLSAFDMI